MKLADGLQVEINVKEALETLRKNREQHGAMVAEARKGYVEQARTALAERLDQLESGKLCALRFDLRPPEDYTGSYNVAIRMLELHTGETVEMDGAQVRTFIMDEWDWTKNFFFANSGYSPLTHEVGTRRGHIDDGS